MRSFALVATPSIAGLNGCAKAGDPRSAECRDSAWYKALQLLKPGERLPPERRASDSAWYKALQRCGLSGFRWHDLRHTWASWHIQVGTPLHILQEMGGWRTPAMVQHYAHLAPKHLAEHADRISGSAPNLHHPKLRVVK